MDGVLRVTPKELWEEFLVAYEFLPAYRVEGGVDLGAAFGIVGYWDGLPVMVVP